MKRVNYLFLFISNVILVSCFGLFDSGSDVIIGDYEVIWVDTHETRSLCKNNEEIVPAYVFGVGYNDKYIFAKQYNVLDTKKQILDTSNVNYYIVTKTQDDYQNKPVYGPLNGNQFIAKCEKLKIKKVKFDLEYPTDLSWQ